MDPGVLLYLLQEAQLDAKALEELLYRRSGLLGVSGLSADMRVLMDSPEPDATAAVDLFVFRLVRELGAMTASLQGLDALVFTAGIGEHAPLIRQRACEGLGWLDVSLDPRANERNELKISAPNSGVSVWVIPTDEERTMARHALCFQRVSPHAEIDPA
jgi:acetate kinase